MIPRAEAVVAISIVVVIGIVAALIVFHPQIDGTSKDLLIAAFGPLGTALGGIVQSLAHSRSNPTQPASPAKE